MADKALICAPEVATALGVGRQRVAELAESAPDFPVAELGRAGHRLWSRTAIERWAAANPDRGPAFNPPELPVEGRIIRAPLRAVEAWAHAYADRQAGGAAVVARMTQETHDILRLARSEAQALNHSWIDSDHLLLALLRPEAPGAARAVLHSLGVALGRARRVFAESFGEPFEPHEREPTTPPATQEALECANVEALDLRDERVSGEHVLLALARERGGASPRSHLLWSYGFEAELLHARVLAATEGVTEVPQSPEAERAVKPERVTPRPDLELAPTPACHDPWRRQPWASLAFCDASGPVIQGRTLRQYFVDRDGNPVLTADGLPVHLTLDDGVPRVDCHGHRIVIPVEVPPGAALAAHAAGGIV